MAKLDNVTKAKIELNNRIIKSMESKQYYPAIVVYHAQDIVNEYNLVENKNYLDFVNHFVSKLNINELCPTEFDRFSILCDLTTRLSLDISSHCVDALTMELYGDKLDFDIVLVFSNEYKLSTLTNELKRLVRHYTTR